jgi:hypothetical protein
VEEINIENKDRKDFHCMKKEWFQDTIDESRILDEVGNKEKDENNFKWVTSHPTQDFKSHEQPIIDFIKPWFQSIIGQEMQS